MDTFSENAGGKQGGRFRPGQSGNPAGRPKGARNRATMVAEALLDGEAEALTRKAVDLALEGDVTCAFAWNVFYPQEGSARGGGFAAYGGS